MGQAREIAEAARLKVAKSDIIEMIQTRLVDISLCQMRIRGDEEMIKTQDFEIAKLERQYEELMLACDQTNELSRAYPPYLQSG